MIGQTVSHYRVLSQLGGGGMGVVYEAEESIWAAMLPSSSCLPRQKRIPPLSSVFSAKHAPHPRLNHPSICTIYEIGEDNGRHFIAMELLEGETLKNRIHGKPFELRSCLILARRSPTRSTPPMPRA